MKTLITFILSAFVATMSIAQEIPNIKVGKDRLGITSLDIKVEVVGNIATTTYDMLFYNPTDETLEGELNFPLGEGQNVSRLALDVNGKLREAVVVEKELGRVAFEAVVRRGVDPVLLEKGTGNNYKARIYPIFRKSHKRVVLAYEQELIFTEGAHFFNLPLGFKNVLDVFSINMTIYDQELKPEITLGKLDNFQFAQIHKTYSANFYKKNYTPANHLTIKIPQKYNSIKSISYQDYIFLYQTLNSEKRPRKKAEKIILFWDTSLSMSKRNVQKEINLLDAYISYLKDIKIEVVNFSNEVKSRKTYTISNGDWSILKEDIINSVYDGGTSYDCLLENYFADEVLLFTDGMNNLSDFVMSQKQPVFVVNSIIMANHAQLNQTSEASNGEYINIKNMSVNEAMETLKYQAFKFLGISSSNSQIEVYPNEPESVSSDFSMAFKNYDENDEIILQFGFGNEVTKEKVVKLKSEASNELVKRFWAQKKLDKLQQDSEENKDEIVTHSKSYNLVSNHTSLIVLESVWDYVKYKITPPEELLEQYNEIMNRNNGKRVVAVGNSTEETEEITTTSTANNSVNGNISGVITDSFGMPLPGVNVIVKGTTKGTQTDFDGRYSINAKTGDVLTFTYIGLVTLESTIASSNIINIAMQEDSAILDEVVVTAQGIKREKKALGYAVSEVRAEELEQRTEGDVARVLSGKASGVQITSQSGTSGSATNVVIRGYTSITGNNQALIIVDGVPFSNDTNAQGSFSQGNFGSSRLSDLDPNNIESINVLKGLAAATLYGTAGKNGVIVITTKAGSPTISRQSVGHDGSSKYNKFVKIKKYIVDNSEPNTSYLRELNKATNPVDAYTIYLDQRESYKNHPAYYIDVYDFFKKWTGQRFGIRILSNIAEIDFDNYELLRAYAYKLEEANNYKLATFIFEQVLKLRPEDAQSYRDLALAYQQIGKSKDAIKLLENIISGEVYKKQGRRKFAGMQSISENELKVLVKNEPEIINELKTNGKEADFDVRVVIDWNHNDTDIDLHVIDPNYEVCSYENTKTKINGRISQDMTQGFGPEEFTLRNAKKGDYFVEVNYFGDRYQKIENPTFMKITLYKYYGTPSETKEIKVVRLTNKKDKKIVAKISI